MPRFAEGQFRKRCNFLNTWGFQTGCKVINAFHSTLLEDSNRLGDRRFSPIFLPSNKKNTTLRGDDEFSPLIKYCEGWWKLKSCWDQCMIFGGFKVKFAQKRHYEIRHFRDRPKSTHSKLSCLFCIDFSNWFYDFGCKQPSTLKQFKIDACSFQRFLHLRYKKRVCIGLSYYILCNII